MFASRIADFQKLLGKPKSVPSSIATTFGHIEPLGFERFRICELYAELLHCSNMILLNDPRGEPIVRERDIERERLRKGGRSNPPKVDIWGDADLGNARFWSTGINASNGSEHEEQKDNDTVINGEQIARGTNNTSLALTASSSCSTPTVDGAEAEKQKPRINPYGRYLGESLLRNRTLL